MTNIPTISTIETPRLTLTLPNSDLAPAMVRYVEENPFQACHLGYNLDYRYQGKGLMYEALTGAINYVFADLELHRVMANYMPTNVRSGKLLRRLGFTVEGYARDYLYLAGAWQDHILTALTEESWYARSSL